MHPPEKRYYLLNCIWHAEVSFRRKGGTISEKIEKCHR